jgi:hypothetical protein
MLLFNVVFIFLAAAFALVGMNQVISPLIVRRASQKGAEKEERKKHSAGRKTI